MMASLKAKNSPGNKMYSSQKGLESLKNLNANMVKSTQSTHKFMHATQVIDKIL